MQTKDPAEFALCFHLYRKQLSRQSSVGPLAQPTTWFILETGCQTALLLSQFSGEALKARGSKRELNPTSPHRVAAFVILRASCTCSRLESHVCGTASMWREARRQQRKLTISNFLEQHNFSWPCQHAKTQQRMCSAHKHTSRKEKSPKPSISCDVDREEEGQKGKGRQAGLFFFFFLLSVILFRFYCHDQFLLN